MGIGAASSSSVSSAEAIVLLVAIPLSLISNSLGFFSGELASGMLNSIWLIIPFVPNFVGDFELVVKLTS